MRYSSVGTEAWCNTDAGSIPRYGKWSFSQSQLSVQTLLRCSHSPHVQLHSSTSVRTLKITDTGSHTIVWTHENSAHNGRMGSCSLSVRILSWGQWSTKTKNTGGWLAGLTDQLFEMSPQEGFDVASLNIQRGRDHGLPSYNEWRDLCSLGKLSSFDEMNFSRKYSTAYEWVCCSHSQQRLLLIQKSETRMTVSVLVLTRSKQITGSKERYLLGKNTVCQLWGVIPLIKLQNDT